MVRAIQIIRDTLKGKGGFDKVLHKRFLFFKSRILTFLDLKGIFYGFYNPFLLNFEHFKAW